MKMPREYFRALPSELQKKWNVLASAGQGDVWHCASSVVRQSHMFLDDQLNDTPFAAIGFLTARAALAYSLSNITQITEHIIDKHLFPNTAGAIGFFEGLKQGMIEEGKRENQARIDGNSFIKTFLDKHHTQKLDPDLTQQIVQANVSEDYRLRKSAEGPFGSLLRSINVSEGLKTAREEITKAWGNEAAGVFEEERGRNADMFLKRICTSFPELNAKYPASREFREAVAKRFIHLMPYLAPQG